MKITKQDMIDTDPEINYIRDNIDEWWGNNEALTPTEITELDIDPGDKLYLLGNLLTPDQQYAFALETAKKALQQLEGKQEQDLSKYAKNAKVWATKFLDGELLSLKEDRLSARAHVACYSGLVSWEWQAQKMVDILEGSDA